MNRTIPVLVAVAVLASAGCSKKELIAQKDAEIADLQGDKAALEAEVAEQKRMTEDLNRQLGDLQEEKRVLLVEKDNLTFITLDGAATFPTASSELSDEGKEILDRIWDVVQQYPDRSILIEGHADNRPISPSYQWKYPSNWELSSARAHAVLHYLVDSHSAEPRRLAAVGYGENNPLTEDSSSEGLSQNRRVVITIGSAKAMRDLISRENREVPMESAEGRIE
jgi:flagellar motor protein MotB